MEATLQELIEAFGAAADAQIDANEYLPPLFIDYSVAPYTDEAINKFIRRDECRAAFIYWLDTIGIKEIHEVTGYPFSWIAFYRAHLAKDARTNTYFNRLVYGMEYYIARNIKYAK